MGLGRLTLDVVVPVFNEERRLPLHIDHLYRYLDEQLTCSWTITIAENGSTDRTWAIAQELAQRYPSIRTVCHRRHGRGRALAEAWQQSQAEVVCYMDVDLATDLTCLPQLLKAVREGSDLAVGSRRTPGAVVQRSRGRAMLSAIYNRLVQCLFRVPVTDTQCGFKAARRQAILPLLAQVRSPAWFFDTELLLRAHAHGLRVQEVPVRWVEDRDSRVRMPWAIVEMGWSLLRLKLGMALNGHPR